MTEEEQKPVVEIVVREVQCAKETLELGEGMVKFVKTLKLVSADGWQLGQDLPPILTSAMADLIPAMDGVTKVGGEYAGSKQAFLNGVMVPMTDLVGALVDA